MSTLNVSNITDGTTTVGTSYVVNGSAKAWFWCDDPVSLVNSMNCSSVTDSGVGDYRVNITNALTSSYGITTLNSLRNANPIASSASGVSMTDNSTIKVDIRDDAGVDQDAEFTGALHGVLA